MISSCLLVTQGCKGDVTVWPAISRVWSMTLTNQSIVEREYSPFLFPAARPDTATKAHPQHAPRVPPGIHRSGRYVVRFAQTHDDLHAVQRLRFQVFNLELREGLIESYARGLDSDAFDLACHHLMVFDEPSAQLVGTYRLMTKELAGEGPFYTESEFELSEVPDVVLRHGAEVGRACVEKEHRNGRVLQLLWRGIARYLDWNDKRYVFGCCSVPTLDASEIWALSQQLTAQQHMHSRYHAQVRSGLRAPRIEGQAGQADSKLAELPPLFASYLRLGAKVCGGPAIDRAFGVTDYLVLLDLRDVEPRMLSHLAAPGRWKSVETA